MQKEYKKYKGTFTKKEFKEVISHFRMTDINKRIMESFFVEGIPSVNLPLKKQNANNKIASVVKWIEENEEDL